MATLTSDALAEAAATRSAEGIVAAMGTQGVELTRQQAMAVVAAEREGMKSAGRVSFGRGVSVSLAESFASSSLLAGSDAAETLQALMLAFFELRELFGTEVPDAEILECLRAAFDGEAGGDACLAAEAARKMLVAQERQAGETYSLVDDEGRVYRWDNGRLESDAWDPRTRGLPPFEDERWDQDQWRDEVTADGWLGEKWDHDYE